VNEWARGFSFQFDLWVGRVRDPIIVLGKGSEMVARDVPQLDKVIRILGKLLSAAVLVGGLVGVLILVILSPVIVMSAYGAGRDWHRAADIGQTYGVASAVLAGGALAVVLASLWLQRGQVRHAKRGFLWRSSREIVAIALEHPEYGQCWGSRFAPDHVDETMFFYTNMIVELWSRTWADRQLTEEHARSYARKFFDSEVPRMFWERHGDWHLPRRTLTHADRFIAIMNEEYLRAIKAGPPSRPYQPPDTLRRGDPRVRRNPSSRPRPSTTIETSGLDFPYKEAP